MEDYENQKRLIRSDKLHEALQEYDVLAIHNAFQSTSDKCLTASELRTVLNKKVDCILEDDDYNNLYNRINKNGQSAITWDDFISYLIMGFEQNSITVGYTSLKQPISESIHLINSNHRSYITRILFCPTLKPNRSMSWTNGSYMTLSRDGYINYWSLDLELERRVQSAAPEPKIVPTWVTDMAVMPDVNIVVTSSTERDLRFFDSSARKFDLRIRFTSIDHAITTMTYYYPESSSEKSKLLLGDMGGNIKVLFIETAERGPFKSKLGLPLFETFFENVQLGLVSGFQVLEFKRIHTDFVRQIDYYKTLHSAVSCASCKKTPLSVLDITDPTRKQNTNDYKVPLGVWCFTIEHSKHIIATGGPDCLIRIWNSFMPSRPIAVLYRHHEGIIQLTFQDEGKTLYSLSKDKNIKVWDMTTQAMIQNFINIPSILGEKKEMTTLYNPDSRQWLIGSAMLAVVPLSIKQSSEHTDGSTHSSGVSVVLYNKLFEIIVTVGIDSYILVWNPWDGRRMLVIKNAHIKIQNGLTLPVEITSATFSPNLHFLLTGAHDGTLKIWDFNSGTCLRNMIVENQTEISNCFWTGTRILSTGWNKRITEFNDKGQAIGYGGAFFKNWDIRHKEDIGSACLRIPETLVTGSYDGDIIMWRLETGQPYKKYNVSNPTTRIKIEYKLPKFQKESAEHLERLSTGSLMNRRSIALPKKNARSSLAVNPLAKRRVSVLPIPAECMPLRKLAVHCMLFLTTRKCDPAIGTLLISLENGVIQVWSHHIAGGFIVSFSAIHKAGDYVICMNSDEKNKYLFTGHSVGYIKVWLIKDFCVDDPTVEVNIPRLRTIFPFMWGNKFKSRASRVVSAQQKPLLLNSFKGHFLSVTSLAYIDREKIIISGSTDFSARMFTLSGRFMQIIGSFKEWKPVEKGRPVDEEFNFSVPADLKRILSSTSLRVFLGGRLSRNLTRKQINRRKEKERISVDPSKVYGKPLNEPFLGHYYNLPLRTIESKDIKFDTTFSYIPVYQNLKIPETVEIKLQAPAFAALDDKTTAVQ